MKILGKRSKLDLTLARSLCGPDTLLVLRTKIARCPLGLEITKGASSGRRTAGDKTDSSQTTPKCASCHKKDKKRPALSYVLFAYSFILQMLFLCHFLLNVISYFMSCGWFMVLFRFHFDVRTLSQSKCALLPPSLMSEDALADLHRILCSSAPEEGSRSCFCKNIDECLRYDESSQYSRLPFQEMYNSGLNA